MKKFLFVLLFILLLGIAALAVFVATFDLNRYKPAIISQLESAVGNPVRIEHLSLGWNGGVALELSGLHVYSGAKAEGEPAISVDRASAVLRLTQLLKREVEIGSIIVSRPQFHILRSGDGAVHVMGFAAQKPPSSSTAFAAFPVLISTIKVEDGLLRFTDAASSVPLEIQVRDLDIDIDEVSFDKPMEVDARMALFAEGQNVFVTGRFRPSFGKDPGILENVRLKVNLGGFDSAKLARVFPGFGNLGVQGEVVADLDRMMLGRGGAQELEAAVQLRDGRIMFPEAGSSVGQIGAVVSIQKDRAEIKHVSADFGGGKVNASGSIGQLTTSPVLDLRGTLADFHLESFQTGADKNAPQLRGTLNGSFHVSSSGFARPQISESLSGEVRVEIKEPVIMNFNLVREVFGRLALIPGLVNTLEKRLPEHYGEKLNRRDTVLEPIQLEGRIERGRILFDRILLASDTFVLTGKVAAGLDGSVSGDAVLRLDPDLSAAFIRSVEELQYLTDREGRLEIPVHIQSVRGRFAAVPDLQYVAAKLAVAKTQEVVGKWLEKKAGAKNEQNQDETGAQTTPQGDLVGSLIGGLLKDSS